MRGEVRIVQLLRTLLTADLDRLASDLYLDAIRVQLAVASGTSLLSHDFSPFTHYPGVISRPFSKKKPLSRSLAI
jgi:hypothetical protein